MAEKKGKISTNDQKKNKKDPIKTMDDFFQTHKFQGNHILLLFFLIVGIFIPPFISIGIVYLLQGSMPKKPRLFDRNIIVFTSSLFFVWLISLLTSKLDFSQAIIRALKGTLFSTLIFYPLVYVWIWNNWHYKR